MNVGERVGQLSMTNRLQEQSRYIYKQKTCTKHQSLSLDPAHDTRNGVTLYILVYFL